LLALINLVHTPTGLGVAIMTTSTKELASNNKDRNDWQWGFTPQAELWNGRFAMLGFMAALLTEWLSGEGILHFYNLMHYMSVSTR
jgi:Chlorophyll A-B binding protein